jgi:hypothetical protein
MSGADRRRTDDDAVLALGAGVDERHQVRRVQLAKRLLRDEQQAPRLWVG